MSKSAKIAAQSAPNMAPKINADAYNEVVARAVLAGIRCIKSSFEAKPDAYASASANRKYLVDYGLTHVRYDAEKNTLRGVLCFSAVWKSGRAREMVLNAEFLVDYDVKGRCSEDAAELFVQRLGPFAAYPYFRALHAMLLDQAGLRSPPLPILAEAPRRIGRAEEVVMASGNPLMEQQAAQAAQRVSKGKKKSK